MALTDHHDVFIGSTGDGWTFVVLNRRIHHAATILTEAGFTPHEQHGRRIVYLLSPENARHTHENAGAGAYELLCYTQDLVDLAWTTRQHGANPAAQPDVTIRFTDGAVTATAATDQAAILVQYGFTPAGARRQYALPPGLGERDALSAVVRAEAHLHADGISVRIDLGIATPQDIPPAPSRPGAATAPPPTTQNKRRSR